jgi:hypothetical protein
MIKRTDREADCSPYLVLSYTPAFSCAFTTCRRTTLLHSGRLLKSRMVIFHRMSSRSLPLGCCRSAKLPRVRENAQRHSEPCSKYMVRSEEGSWNNPDHFFILSSQQRPPTIPPYWMNCQKGVFCNNNTPTTCRRIVELSLIPSPQSVINVYLLDYNQHIEWNSRLIKHCGPMKRR